MADKLRWGLLSTARINRSLIPAIRASKRSELLAVGSRKIGTARQYARERDIPHVHGSYEDLLADPQIDVIYNSLPNHLHAEWTIKALNAGKHVLLEKPLALSTTEVEAIRKAAEATGNTVAEAFMYRHHPQTFKVQELIETGTIGEVLYMQGDFTFILDNPTNIRAIPEYGGGSIWDIGCYPISFFRMVAGHLPNSVHGYQVLSNKGIDWTFAGHMDYPNGIVAQFYSSFGLPYHTQMEIRGTKGTIVVLQPFLIRKPDVPLLLRLDSENEQKIVFPPTELYLGEVEDMEKAILDGKKPRISLVESQENIATILALLESAKKNSIVKPIP